MVNGRVVKQEISADIEEAKLELYTQLESLSRHSYNNRRQHNKLRKLKENLPTKEIIILEDFAENYLIKHQSEIMQAHWSSPSVTIFTAVVYYKIGYELKHLCYAVISDSLNHSKDSVHALNEAIFNDLQTKFDFGISFVHYYTDGAASQFKSRYTVCDLLFHEKEFGFLADHSYFETSHGKGPHDGVGGEVKRVILRSELQKKL